MDWSDPVVQSYIGGLISGGVATKILEYLLFKNKDKRLSLFKERKVVYGKLFAALRSTKPDDELVHSYLNKASLLTSSVEAKEIFRKIGNDLQNNKYWNDPSGNNARRLRRLDVLLGGELGVSRGRVTSLLSALGGRRYADLGRNDLCACGSGKKYKNCCLNCGRLRCAINTLKY